ncbi:hypothetical protein AAFF_G00279200 [Aldrovandia affinis]|uniref:PDZ domain-containing protein n=1 Tax=Aldrovandia affinis TaxID=143900 RepID=A0AAD7ST60_9TELE|nr:hypothetical protein AAFF_G00279200 [Aldrovandia affinis]
MAHKPRSKSTSSIPVDQDQKVLWKVRCEELQKIRDQVKESEEQWRDDLTRWMSHRRCVNSDLERKREERERTELAARGSGAREPEPFWETQEGESRERGSAADDSPAFPSTRPAVSLSPSPAPDRCRHGATPRTASTRQRAELPSLPLRTRASASTSNASRPGIATCADRPGTELKDQTSGSPAVHARTATTDPTSAGLANRTSTASGGQTSAAFMDRVPRSPADRTGRIVTGQSGTGEAKESSVYKASEPRSPIGSLAGEKSPSASYNLNSMDTKPAAAQVSASLPRSARRSDSSRLASVVSPRPFGTQSTRVGPVSRAFTMDDSHKRFNGETKRYQNSPALSQQRPILTPENEPPTLASSVPSRNGDEGEEGRGTAPSHGPPFPHRTSCNPSQPKMASTVSSGSEVNTQQSCYGDIRVRLNQKPNSSQDFGFQSSWDSTGAFIESIQRGSPAEQGPLRVGDAIVAVGSRRATELSSEQWKGSMDATSQQGSVVLDVRRNGQNGSPEKYINTSNDFTFKPTLDTAVKTSHALNSQGVTDVDCKGMNGGFRPESVGSKGSDPVTLKNLKRRSEFFEQQGGSESAISDLRVPSISTSSNRASWDPIEERKRQEKWQQEQERLLQEKYKRDQEKLDEEWRRAQRDAVGPGSGCREAEQKPLEADLRSLSPLSPMSPLSQTTPPPWEEPNRPAERVELGVTQLQRAEPHKEEAERKAEGEELGLQRKFEGEGQQTRPGGVEERKMCQQATEECPRQQDGGGEKEQCKGNSDGLAKIHPEISPSDRAKSQSTPELDEVDKPEGGVVSRTTRAAPPSQEAQAARKKNRPLSQVELDRLQILEEMKKKTQLVTDSSWIRQRSTCIYKEPIHLGGGMRRYESLDNLNSARSWRQPQWPPSPASSAHGARPQSAVSDSASSGGCTRPGSSTLPTSHSAGSLRQGPWSLPSPTSPTPPTTLNEEPTPEPRPLSQQRSRSVSGRKMCELCATPLGRGAAMFIQSLGLCFHLGCFKVREQVARLREKIWSGSPCTDRTARMLPASCFDCKSDLRGSESGAGAEVRLRDRKLYCNPCHARFSDGRTVCL